MARLDQWSIRARAHRCTITDQPFEEGQDIYTAIFPHPEEAGYLRQDYTEDGWEKRPQDSDAPRPFSYWKSTYEPPEQEDKEEAVTRETAEDLLSRLIDEDRAHTENARYILAIMLERQKLLKETDTQPTPSGTLRIYQHKKTGEIFIIKDPNIPLDQIETIQQEVSELLEQNDNPQS